MVTAVMNRKRRPMMGEVQTIANPKMQKSAPIARTVFGK
jgi:hypothetical protein